MDVGKFRPSPSMVVAFVALAVAIGGTAYAASKIGTNQIKNNAVTAKKIKKNAVTSSEIKGKSVTAEKLASSAVETKKLAADAVDGSKVADDSLSGEELSDYKVLGGDSFLRVVATAGLNEAAARAAAPENPLYSKGPLELYAKCFRDVGADRTFGEIYVRTTAEGSIMEGDDDLPGGPLLTDFLNPDTLEVDRVLDGDSVTGNDASYNESESLAAAPDGTGLSILTGIGAKNGAVAVDGPYGAGNACIFHGPVMG